MPRPEYQEMVRDELVSKRLARLDTVAELAEATVLDQEQIAAWMGAVNDIRLVLGTRLGVTEDDEFEETDEEDPDAVARSAYWYLGWLLAASGGGVSLRAVTIRLPQLVGRPARPAQLERFPKGRPLRL